MTKELSPEFIGFLSHNMAIASRKQTLQMKAARWRTLKKAIIQNPNFCIK